MSTLNTLIKLRKEFPNNADFGAEVAKLIDKSRTCCSDPKNHTKHHVEDSGPYGYYGTETRCVCGKMIDFKLDRS